MLVETDVGICNLIRQPRPDLPEVRVLSDNFLIDVS